MAIFSSTVQLRKGHLGYGNFKKCIILLTVFQLLVKILLEFTFFVNFTVFNMHTFGLFFTELRLIKLIYENIVEVYGEFSV